MEPLSSDFAARKVAVGWGVAAPAGRMPPEIRPAPASDRLELSSEAESDTKKLKAIDQKVRAHEAAHQAAGAGLVGGASFTYQRGSDGRMYAVGGEVSIDSSPVPGDPRATVTKMQQVQAAALAPADPSAQDRAVAAAAATTSAAAQIEVFRMAQKESPAKGGNLDLSV